MRWEETPRIIIWINCQFNCCWCCCCSCCCGCLIACLASFFLRLLCWWSQWWCYRLDAVSLWWHLSDVVMSIQLNMLNENESWQCLAVSGVTSFTWKLFLENVFNWNENEIIFKGEMAAKTGEQQTTNNYNKLKKFTTLSLSGGYNTRAVGLICCRGKSFVFPNNFP